MIIKCYFQSCKATVEVDLEHAAPAAFAWRNQNSLSGKPWTCPFHETMLEATLQLAPHEVVQLRELVSQIRIGRMTKGGQGFYEQVPPKPVTPYSIREDNGTIRTSTMEWWTTERMIAALTPEPTPEAAGYTVTITDPPPGAKRDAEDFEL